MCWKWWRMTLYACLMLMTAGGLQAHPADVSALRILVERQRLEFRFTFTLLTLGRMAELDRNQDLRVDEGEMQSVRPEVERFLQEHVQLRVNDQTTRFGHVTKLEPLWPPVESVDLREVDRVVDVTLEMAWPEVIGSFWMEFTGLTRLGEEATVQATYVQGDLNLQVPFSRGEPDYQYDTGFAVEDLFKAPTEGAAKPPDSEKAAASQTAMRPWVNVFLMGVFLVPLVLWIFRRNKDD